jgi:hypothetical protein
MNARAEAIARLDGRYDARVLEPSPPAIAEPPWFADDPVGRGEPRGELPRVSPVAGADLRWEDVVDTRAGLDEWCAERWLASYHPLEDPPRRLVRTRAALHRLAEHVIAPAREHANGKIGLRYTHCGFGTPFFGADVQLRVVSDMLVVQRGNRESAEPISTLASAASHLGEELLPRGCADEEPLEVDPAASRFLGEWFGFGASLLEELRAGVGDDAEPSRVQLWPEHFDISVELGSESAGARAGYGASPGDEDHAEPYLYVAPWGDVQSGDALFDATAFKGAELPYSELLAAAQGGGANAQRELALSFFRERLSALDSRA